MEQTDRRNRSRAAESSEQVEHSERDRSLADDSHSVSHHISGSRNGASGHTVPKHGAAQILTVQSVAEYLRVHPATIYRLLKRKELPAFKIGRDWRFRRKSIDHWRSEAERRAPLSYYKSTDR
jgi:excisionase family DNA binding protein